MRVEIESLRLTTIVRLLPSCKVMTWVLSVLVIVDLSRAVGGWGAYSGSRERVSHLALFFLVLGAKFRLSFAMYFSRLYLSSSICCSII